jgi:hypothetical protein
MTIDEQVNAALWEMQTYHKYAPTWRALHGSDPGAMLDALVENYERPAHPAAEIAKRKGF